MIEHTIGDLVERCARAYSNDTALVDGNRRRSYGELISDVRRTGRALRGLGLEKGDRVGLLMEDRAELATAYYGALWAGLAVVPINTRLGAEDQEYNLGDAGVRALVHDAAHAERVSRMDLDAEELLSVDADGVLDGGGELARLAERESDAFAAPDAAPDDLAAIYYTGGTTGRPKGVAHSHRTLVAAILSETIEFEIGAREVFAHVAPLTHASGLFVLPTWLRGGTNVLLGGFDPDKLRDAVAKERATATLMVPTMVYVLLDEGIPPEDIDSLSTVVYGAAPMGKERLVQALETFGPIFTQLYGQTEAPNQISVLAKHTHADALEHDREEMLTSCGRPVTIAEVRLADDDLNTVERGEVGEILARGPHLMLEYWNKPEETAETVRDSWLCTGDMARADESGLLYIVDRKKDMIITGGLNVYPKQVEDALFGHEAVRDVAVIGVPDDKWGEAVKAVVVAKDDEDVSGDELASFVKERHGSVSAPKSVDFVDEIPVTALGKHDRAALRESYWSDRERSVN